MPAKNLSRTNEEDTYFLIYNKGVEKRSIFIDEEDYRTFLIFLEEYLTTPKSSDNLVKTFQIKGRTFQGIPHQPKNYLNQIEVVAYKLKPNNFHIILHQVTKGSLEKFLRSLFTRYSMYFNKKYQHSGALFEGPYKSVPVTDLSLLSYLTRYLHQPGKFSSFPEYQGLRKTLWIKPEIVLSTFGEGTGDGEKSLKLEGSNYKNYKIFVEQYESDEKGKDLIKEFIFEKNNNQLERSIPSKEESVNTAFDHNKINLFERNNLTSIVKTNQDPNFKRFSRIRTFIGVSSIIYVLLIALGLRSITVSAAKQNQSMPLPVVLSENTEVKIETPPITPTKVITETTPETTPEVVLDITPEATPEATPEVAPRVTPEVTSEVKPISIVTVSIKDGSKNVNIRQKPTTSSEIIGHANNNDTFESVSTNSGWYEVILKNDSRGFISKKYITTEGALLKNE